jgi:hypothetical protein
MYHHSGKKHPAVLRETSARKCILQKLRVIKENWVFARSKASAAIEMNSSAFWDITPPKWFKTDVSELRINPVFKSHLKM